MPYDENGKWYPNQGEDGDDWWISSPATSADFHFPSEVVPEVLSGATWITWPFNILWGDILKEESNQPFHDVGAHWEYISRQQMLFLGPPPAPCGLPTRTQSTSYIMTPSTGGGMIAPALDMCQTIVEQNCPAYEPMPNDHVRTDYESGRWSWDYIGHKAWGVAPVGNGPGDNCFIEMQVTNLLSIGPHWKSYTFMYAEIATDYQGIVREGGSHYIKGNVMEVYNSWYLDPDFYHYDGPNVSVTGCAGGMRLDGYGDTTTIRLESLANGTCRSFVNGVWCPIDLNFKNRAYFGGEMLVTLFWEPSGGEVGATPMNPAVQPVITYVKGGGGLIPDMPLTEFDTNVEIGRIEMKRPDMAIYPP